MVVIKCDNCGTLYDLDENLIPPSGAPVQCTRCQHVFIARKPAPASAAAPPPPAAAPAPTAPPPSAPPGPRPGARAPVRAQPEESSTMVETPVFKPPAPAAFAPPASPQVSFASPAPPASTAPDGEEEGTLRSVKKITAPAGSPMFAGPVAAPPAPASAPPSAPAPSAPPPRSPAVTAEVAEMATLAFIPPGLGSKAAKSAASVPAPRPPRDGGEMDEEPTAPGAKGAAPKGAPAKGARGAATTQPPGRAQVGARTMLLEPVAGEHGVEDEFDMVMRKSRRNRNIALGFLGALVLSIAAAVAWPVVKRMFTGGATGPAQRKAREAHALLLRDDEGSLQRAAEVYAEAIALDPKWAPLKADRSLPLQFLATSLKEQLDAVSARDRALEDKLAALQQKNPDGWQSDPAADPIREEKKKLSAKQEPILQRFTALKKEAGELLKAAQEGARDHPDVLRARGLTSALEGDEDRALKVLDHLRKTEEDDALAAYARGALYASGAPAQEKREKAVEALRAALVAEPGLLRARYDLARSLADLGRKDDALKELEALLTDNPAHERAAALKERLSAPPPRKPAPAAPTPPPAEGAPGAPATTPN